MIGRVLRSWTYTSKRVLVLALLTSVFTVSILSVWQFERFSPHASGGLLPAVGVVFDHGGEDADGGGWAIEKAADENALPGQLGASSQVSTRALTPAASPGKAGARVEAAGKARVPVMRLAVVACGVHADRAKIGMKSAVMLSRRRIHFHILSDSEEVHKNVSDTLQSWPDVLKGRVTYSTHNLYYPPGENVKEWKGLFRQCATVRLFLADALSASVDSILYVDSDVVFVSPVEEIWGLFSRFNSTQLASMTPEHEEERVGWYNRHGRHPYFGKTGLNSGVMLMNLTRIRSATYQVDGKGITWSDYIVHLFRKYRNAITWGDQDILNIFFHFNPGQLYVHGCEWNYRPDHCFYRPFASCPASEARADIYLLHMNRNAAFQSRFGRLFGVLYQLYAAQEARSISPGNTSLAMSLETRLSKELATGDKRKNCDSIDGLLVKALTRGLGRLSSE